MVAEISHFTGLYRINLSSPIDISTPLHAGGKSINAYYAPPFNAVPVTMDSFVGSVAQGAPVNYVNVQLNPHGNGTHTECVGHISEQPFTINQCLQQFFFLARVVSIFPVKMVDGDQIIFKELLEKKLQGLVPEAIIIRTLPNDGQKLTAQYSGANPPYFHHEAITYLVKKGVKHILTDLPSLDKEEDGGHLLAHKAFWQFPQAIREDATITELVYAPNEVVDGLYFLNLQIAAFEIDASPSKPILYKIL